MPNTSTQVFLGIACRVLKKYRGLAEKFNGVKRFFRTLLVCFIYLTHSSCVITSACFYFVLAQIRLQLVMSGTDNVKKANLKVKLNETLFSTADLSKTAADFREHSGYN